MMLRHQYRKLTLEQFEARLLLAGEIWSQRGGDAGHTSYVDVEVDPGTISEAWFQALNYTQSGTGSWRERAVAIDESHVYRTALEGYAPVGTYHIIAYDLSTGAEVWHNTLIGNAFEGVGEPSVAGGVVYVNRAGHSGISGGTSADLPRLYGYDTATGATVLQQAYAAQWGSNERPVIDGDQLIVEDGYYGGISAYTASTLTEQWFVGRSAAYSPPFSALNDQYAFAFGNEVYRRSDGVKLSNVVHPADFSSVNSPIVADDGDALFSYTGRVDGVSVRGIASFDGSTRAHQWSYETDAGVNQKSVGNGLVALTAGNTLHVLNESDGSLVRTWTSTFNLGEVLLTQSHAFVISLNTTTATVHAVNLDTGVVDWSHSQVSPGGSALVEMAMSQGFLILSDRTGVRAFDLNGPPANQPPTAVDDAFSSNEDESVLLNVLANDTDPDQDSLAITSVTAAANGTVVVEGGQIRYTPDANFHGVDEFDYVIDDGNGGSDTAAVHVTVAPVNDAPAVVDAVFSIEENAAAGVSVGTISATDVDGDDLSYALQGSDSLAFDINAATGEISVVESALLDFETSPQFDFEVLVSDGQGGSTTANVQVNLLNVLEVEIDVLPADPLNSVSLKSKTIEVAILANADLDPLTMLDVSSLRLRSINSATGASVSLHKKHGFRVEYRDVNGDGSLDLVVKFDTSDTGLAAGDDAVELSGALLPEFGGETFSVIQAVQVNQRGRGNGRGKR